MVKEPYVSFLPKQQRHDAASTARRGAGSRRNPRLRVTGLSTFSGTRELLEVLDGMAEVVVWTAGSETMLKASLRASIHMALFTIVCIDTQNGVWETRYSKNLATLGGQSNA